MSSLPTSNFQLLSFLGNPQFNSGVPSVFYAFSYGSKESLGFVHTFTGKKVEPVSWNGGLCKDSMRGAQCIADYGDNLTSKFNLNI